MMPVYYSSRNSALSSKKQPVRRTKTWHHNERSVTKSKKQLSVLGNMTPHTPTTINGSFTKMCDSLTRSLSLSWVGGKSITSNHSVDEMNVFASDIVSKEFILDRLKEVRHNPNIVKLEVEDLLIARNHNSFLPIVKAILVTEQSRNWQCLRFVDTIPSNDYLWWQGMKHVLMREYEETFDDIADYANIVSFTANIQVMGGTSAKEMSTLLKNIIKDKDVENVAFGGALFGYHDGSISRALLGVMDEETGLTKQAFVINVKCGWEKLVAEKKNEQDMDDDDSESNVNKKTKNNEEEHQFGDWAKVLKNLHRTLRQFGRATTTTSGSNPQDDDMDGHSMDSTSLSNSYGSYGSYSTANSEGTHRSRRSTNSAESGGGRRRIPRSSRHLQRRGPPQRSRSGCSSGSESPLPIVRGGGASRRSIHMPATRTSESSHAAVRSPVRSPVVPSPGRVARRSPNIALQRSKSMQMRKRPSLENLDDSESEFELEEDRRNSDTMMVMRDSSNRSTGKRGGGGERATLRRSNSLNVQRFQDKDNNSNSLLDDVKPMRSHQKRAVIAAATTGADDALFVEMPTNQPCGSLDSWLEDKRSSTGSSRRSRHGGSKSKSKKQLQRSKSLNLHHRPLNVEEEDLTNATTGNGKEEEQLVVAARPHNRRHHHRSSSESRSKSLSKKQHHHQDGGYDSDKTPDYDWSVGEYVEKHHKRTLSPPPVASGPMGNYSGQQRRCPAA